VGLATSVAQMAPFPDTAQMPDGGRGCPATVRRRRLAVVLVAVASATAGLTGRVHAAVVACGSTVTQNLTLTADVGPCTAGGIIVTADNVQVDLGGHRVFGGSATGDGVGIRIQGAQGVTVTNGSVTNFDAGVVISGGSANTVSRLKTIANIGAAGATAFGDGILISGSSSNLLSSNEVRSNGPFSGISVIGTGSVGNKISKNIVQNNDIATDADTNQDSGIRLEANTRETTIKRNVISFSGLDGISVFGQSKRNSLIENVVKFNGFHDEAHRHGDGIRVFGDVGAAEENLIQANSVNDNAASGVVLSENATQNTVKKNKAKRNGLQASGSFDLLDGNLGCDSNTWTNNTGGTKSPSCVH
jgi:large repetitive protein